MLAGPGMPFIIRVTQELQDVVDALVVQDKVKKGLVQLVQGQVSERLSAPLVCKDINSCVRQQDWRIVFAAL